MLRLVKEALIFDDVLLIPVYSTVLHHTAVLSIWLDYFKHSYVICCHGYSY